MKPFKLYFELHDVIFDLLMNIIPFFPDLSFDYIIYHLLFYLLDFK